MFSAARYVVVDDEEDQLRMLVDSLHSIGAPCVGVHYTGKPLNPRAFAGVRLLFSDLYLISGNSSQKVQFAAIEAMLRTNIDPTTGGPYLLILWTSHDEQVGALRAYLRERLEPAKLPLAVLELDKKPFLVKGDGKGDPEGLAKAVHAQVNSSPEIRALISWEGDVLAAAGATLVTVTDLIAAEERDLDGFAEKLNGILSLLAVASAGKPNVPLDRRGAINNALAPILADRIMNARERPEVAGIWDQAITRDNNLPVMDDAQIGRMNRMLHISMPPAEPLDPKDWGAVLLLPAGERQDQPMMARFGVKYAELLSQVFHLDKPGRARSRPVMVRIGAVCDHAQRKTGPLPYVLGVLVPVDVQRKELEQLKSEFESPILLIDPAEGPVHLYVNARFQIALVAPPVEWTPLFRIREQLLMMISAHAAEYQTRPGIVKLPI
ncbi:hypothetical protein NKH95_01885 [Mesorhizobium sp. M0848]|uniref:hypothetical protein n=1 Tax=Mesorhizobium sp. M0848 TaxID=2957012 RepID=UPI003335D031